MDPSDTLRVLRALLLLPAVLMAGPLSLSPAAAEERVESKDTKGNGKPDEWRYYEGNTLVRIERDLKGNGQHSVKIYFENGKQIRSEVDRNGDGKPDIIRFFDKEGKPDREQADLNFDGKWDAWIFYKNGVKDLMIMDRDFDGKPDAWFYYDGTGQKLIGWRMDRKFNGKFETFGKVPEKDDRKPW